MSFFFLFLLKVFLIGLAVYIVNSTANNLAVNQGLQPINQCLSWLLLGKVKNIYFIFFYKILVKSCVEAVIVFLRGSFCQ